MKRYTTILTFLMLVCMGVWAEEVTLTPANGTYVTSTGNYVNSISFSTTPAITITASANNMDKRQTGSYLLWHSGQSGTSTYTISAPSGWFITAYTVTGEANTSVQTLTAGAVSHEFAVGTSSSFTVSDLSSQTVSFVQTGANASGLKITSITVTLEESINVTYNLYESDGETFVSSQIVAQRKNSVITIPESLKNGYLATDYDYAASGTIGTTDCSIKVTRTLKANGNTPSLIEGAYMSVGSAATSMTPATSATDNNHWYLVTQTRNSSGSFTPIYNVSTYSTVKRATSSVTNITLNDVPLSANEKYLVRFIETGENTGLYYMQFADGNYITSNLMTAQTVNSAGTFAFYKVTGGTYGGDDKFGWNLNNNTGSRVDNNGAGNGISLWGSGTNDGTGANNVWTIYPVELTVPSAFVQYVISDASGVVYTSDEVPASLNDVITTLPAAYQRDYCSYEVTETTVTSSGVTTVPVTVSYDLPFTVSADYSTATWYYLKLHDKYAYYDTSVVPYPLETSKSNVNIQYSPYAMWAFMGNPYDGIIVLNKAAGESKYLDSSNDQPQMGGTLNSNVKWTITRQSVTAFSLKVGNKCLNDYNGDGKLSYWQSGSAPSDAGSALTIENVTWKELAVADVSLYASNHGVGIYFGADETTVNTTVNSIKEFAGTFTETMYNDVISDLSSLTKYPATGYYRIKNNGTGDYIGYGQPAAAYNVKTPGLIAISSDNVATDASSIIRLTGSEGTYKLSTEGLNVQSQTTGSQAFPATSSTGVDFVFTSSNNDGIVSITNAASRVDDNNDGSMHNATGWTVNGIVNWSASSANSKWVVEDATSLTVNLSNVDGMYYATFCAPFSYTVSEGTTAYTLSQSGEWLIPTAVVGEVPAGTPVLLKGTVSSATLTIGSGYAATPLTTTSISGTYTTMDFALSGTPAATAEYFLGKKNGVLGFYHSGIASKEGYYTLGANKAYLASGVLARGYAIMWDDSETTGIENIDSNLSQDKGGKAVYDLQGRKVANPSRGLYIINGKKVVIK